MKTVFASATLAASAFAFVSQDSEKEFEFMKFIAKFGKDYKTIAEFEHRMGTWHKMDSFIKLVNSPDSEYTHTAGHNKFSDWTTEEFEAIMTLQKPLKAAEDYQVQPLNSIRYEVEDLKNLGVATSLDWRQTGCVTPVKDQGSCGSCWAFSTTETMESAYCLNGGPLLELSPQQLVDCCTAYGGCNGGDYPLAWEYFTDHGQETNDDYPYTALDGTCVYNSNQGRTYIPKVNGKYHVSLPDPSAPLAIMQAVENRPNAIGINASSGAFQSYASGVLAKCGLSNAMNHAVALEGYDASGSEPYFLVRNSWGVGWGEFGYVKFAMTDGKGPCGMNQDVDYPMPAATWTN